jgi:hypothetical protein
MRIKIEIKNKIFFWLKGKIKKNNQFNKRLKKPIKKWPNGQNNISQLKLKAIQNFTKEIKKIKN